MSSPRSRRRQAVDPEQADVERAVSAELAADADKPHPAVDWRATVAGGNPETVAIRTTPTEWQSFVPYPAATARIIAAQAAAEGLRNGNEWIKELVIATLHQRTGIPAAELRGFGGPHSGHRRARSATLQP